MEIFRKGTVFAFPELCGNTALPQNLHPKKLSEITVLFAVSCFGFAALFYFCILYRILIYGKQMESIHIYGFDEIAHLDGQILKPQCG